MLLCKRPRLLKVHICHSNEEGKVKKILCNIAISLFTLEQGSSIILSLATENYINTGPDFALSLNSLNMPFELSTWWWSHNCCRSTSQRRPIAFTWLWRPLAYNEPVWDDLCFVTWCVIMLFIIRWVKRCHKRMRMFSSNTQTVECWIQIMLNW